MISIQSSAPPPPPPLPATPVGLLVAAVTVRVADAGAVLLPAGPVTRALEGMLAVYMLAVALCTLKEISQLSLAGILAADRLTLLVVLVSVSDAPPQVLDGAGVPTVRFAGKDTVIPDCVNAKPLVLPRVPPAWPTHPQRRSPEKTRHSRSAPRASQSWERYRRRHLCRPRTARWSAHRPQ